MSDASEQPGLRILGVTGGVGAGKSTVARALGEALSAPILDADELVSRQYEDPQLLEKIEVRLGVPIMNEDGSLDREALGLHVFEHPEDREELEKLLHPAVRKEIWLALAEQEAREPGSFVILDVPLLREGGLDRICSYVVHVAVPEEVRRDRACARHRWSEDQWKAREAAQMPEPEKARRADAILDNLAGPEALPERIEALAPSLHRLPPRPYRQRWPAWDLDPIP